MAGTSDNDDEISDQSKSANVQPQVIEPAHKTSGDNTVTTDTPSSEDLNADSNSVASESDQPNKIEMSEDISTLVPFEDALHKFSPEEDKELLSNCWMSNLSPTWTSSAHIPLSNSKELLCLNWMLKGYESGFWSQGVPSGLWIPEVYKQLSLSSIIDIKKRIVGELQCAGDLKRQPKTHQF